MSALDLAREHIRRGRAPVPIPFRKKGPGIKGWEALRITAAEAPRYFNGEAQNVGVVLGEASGGLVDADLDCPQAIRVAGEMMPPTESVFGRRGKPFSHRIYRSAAIDPETGEVREERCETAQFRDPTDKSMLVELRGDGGFQTVFPGSTHESGEPIEWVADGDPGLVRAELLHCAMAELAAVALLAKRWPAGKHRDADGNETAGGRHNANLVTAGWLTRSGWGEERVALILERVSVAAGAERDKGKRQSIARDAARRLKSDGVLYGWTAFVELFGEKVAGKVAEWLEVKREQPRAAEAGDAEVEADRSHDALALKLGARWVRRAGYVRPWDRWLFFDGHRWVRDEKLKHFTQTREFLREEGSKLIAWAECQRPKLIEEHGEGKGGALADKLDRWAKSEASLLRNKSFVASVIELARSNPEQACAVGMWDADPWLLGTPGGTLDLRTGALRSASPDDCITKLTAVAPAPPGTPTPMWDAFLARIFRHDPELIPYMQRAAGYATCGVATEHALIFAWGQGGNGKTVFFNALAAVLRTGEDGYAAVAPSDMLLQTQGDRHPADMAMLRGSRLAIASELAAGRSWDEPKLKNLTGGDPITARFMRQDFFTYQPQFTLAVAGNHKPGFRGVDEALRRRVQLVPFLQNLPKEERDTKLPEKLAAEYPGILRWMLDGCLAWQREGLNPPASVLEASANYLEGEDTLGQWIDARCEVGGPDLTPLTALFKDWQEWCAANGGPQWGGKTFGKELDERGFRRDRTGTVRGHRHIKLKAETAEGFGWEAKL